MFRISINFEVASCQHLPHYVQISAGQTHSSVTPDPVTYSEELWSGLQEAPSPVKGADLNKSSLSSSKLSEQTRTFTVLVVVVVNFIQLSAGFSW